MNTSSPIRNICYVPMMLVVLFMAGCDWQQLMLDSVGIPNPPNVPNLDRKVREYLCDKAEDMGQTYKFKNGPTNSRLGSYSRRFDGWPVYSDTNVVFLKEQTLATNGQKIKVPQTYRYSSSGWALSVCYLREKTNGRFKLFDAYKEESKKKEAKS